MRMWLQRKHRSRDLALINIGLDSKLRACDLVSLKVRDISYGEHVASRATVQQKKTKRPVQFEITTPAREAAEAWIRESGLRNEDYLFLSRPLVKYRVGSIASSQLSALTVPVTPVRGPAPRAAVAHVPAIAARPVCSTSPAALRPERRQHPCRPAAWPPCAGQTAKSRLSNPLV
jgi:hypothetical protein